MDLLPLKIELESKKVLKILVSARAALAELKGIIKAIPNQNILIDTLTLREARESSAIENIISTMDEVFQSNMQTHQFVSANAKEVHQYAEALKKGFALVKEKELLTNNIILNIQQIVEQNNAGFRKLSGTKLLNDKTGEVVYTPPQDELSILQLMNNLEAYINTDESDDTDPLIKMAIIHHRFESIHPFYDGNGRTGRIINILYLVLKGLLDLPVLYLSNYIIHSKSDYYRLLQQVRVTNEWEDWILYMIKGVEITAKESIRAISSIRQQMQEYKNILKKELPKIYSQELLNNLFQYPYTKIELIEKDLAVTRNTAIKYLNDLEKKGLVKKIKKGRTNFYINESLFRILSGNTT
ncbi:MAG TPA: Fic/DOC family N-terminal domain-containing protein [Chitinophagaceae bacterium]|nr:Fic/DOC family N-terminal domain-containing protein [Chitinophagaceae bacterium]